MYKLYYAPGTCSLAIHALLNELGVEFEAVKVSTKRGEPGNDILLNVNPRGSVPVIEDDGFRIREGGAIITYLCDQNKSNLIPASGKERAAALEWLMFCNATLHPAYARVFALKKCTDNVDAAVEFFITAINKLWADVELHLASNKYLAGNNVTAGDILLTVIANWSPMISPKIKPGPNTTRLLAEISSREAFKKALQVEQVEYRAAA